MSTVDRVARLRAANPAAADLARICALAARVEPNLVRRLRLLIPEADAAAEADLWFSDLVSARDATALALDPLAADLLRDELRSPDLASLRETAAAEITAAHAGAHWSVRLEERLHYLDVTDPDSAEIDDLLLAALQQLRTEPDPRGIARWLLGAADRLPRRVSERTAGRASAAAAMLHLDRQAPAPTLLDAGESQTWLPWLAEALPRVAVPVRLLDGAIILGATGPNTELLPDVPDTDPLVIEARWLDGTRAASQRVRFRLGEPVHVETGASQVTLITLTGTSYELVADNLTAGGFNFDHIKQNLRPCLAREYELELLASTFAGTAPTVVTIVGPPGTGASTVLVAAADAARANGFAVIEHFSAAEVDEISVYRSYLVQLEAYYPTELSADPADDLGSTLASLADAGAFRRLPLIVAFDGRNENHRPYYRIQPPPGAHLLLTGESRILEGIPGLLVGLTIDSNRRVCLAMIERDRDALERAFAEPVDGEALADLANDFPGRLAKIIGWAARQPAGTVAVDTVPRILTRFWRDVLREWEARFGGGKLGNLLDILAAACGRNSWQDCADEEEADWTAFWEACLAANLVVDVPPDGIVELTEPAAVDLLPRNAMSDAHLLLSLDDTPEGVWSASPTRLSAATAHGLAVDGSFPYLTWLCTDLGALSRRYLEDVSGLLADLEAVAGVHDELARLVSLRSIIHGLHRDGVPPAGFAAELRDRLVEHGMLDTVPAFAEEETPLPPLRVRRMISEPDLLAATPVQTHPGPVLALTQLYGTRLSIPTPDGILLVTEAGLSTMDGKVPLSGWSRAVGASRGDAGGFALWTTETVWTDTMLDSIGPVGPIDHAARLVTLVAIAHPYGGLTIIPMPGTPGTTWRVPGHGAGVTAIMQWEQDVVVGSEDGTIRRTSPNGSTLDLTGHRAAVRALARITTDTFVSGGDDGSLLCWDGGARPRNRWQSTAAITCLDQFAGNVVVFGTADGRVEMWDAGTGAVTPLGRHVGPVRGIAVEFGLVVSWSGSVRFWDGNAPGPLGANVIGFPGGVRDIILGESTYTVLCGDGSVQRRVRPDLGTRTEHPERTCLAILDASVYIGLGDTLTRISPDDDIITVNEGGPFIQAAPSAGQVLTIRSDREIRLAESSVPADVIAPGPGGAIVAFGSTINPPDQIALTTPAPVTSLGVSSWIAAGLANGDTVVFGTGTRTLTGRGTAVSAVAVLRDGSVLTGSRDGILQWWPADPAQGAVTFPRRSGAITGIVAAGPWVLSAGEDGVLVLWATDPVRPVHQIRLGPAVVALAAESRLVAARDALGRLWTFELDFPVTGAERPTRLQVSLERRDEPDDPVLVELYDDSTEPYELTAIRVSVNGQPVPATVQGHWPRLEPDGSLTVPVRPLRSQPLVVACPPPARPGPIESLTVTLDVNSRHNPGYRTRRIVDVYPYSSAAR